MSAVARASALRVLAAALVATSLLLAPSALPALAAPAPPRVAPRVAPRAVPALAPAAPSLALAAPARRWRAVFDDGFGSPRWGKRGAVWSDRTSAYADGASDPDQFKFDRVQAAAMKVSHGQLHITASPTTAAVHGPWRTGLLTTEPWHGGVAGGNGFQLRAGDYALIRMRLPGRQDGGGHGAWPAVWTWRDGNEVDLMEWHSETPGIIEFANHTPGASSYSFVHSPLVGFGRWITVAVRFGATDVGWYVGDDTHPLRLAYQDHVGVGAKWHAYLIASLSVSAQPGRLPSSAHPISMAIDRIRVFR
ncbi:beta-glucanase [Streptacidiphilus sp. N1-3]|uniref:Beta-glucanase n=1 Tax=Streptacidiphilus alkalitolerans TaxID=3342712 RepID=A0ABV6WYS8_9ACTN